MIAVKDALNIILNTVTPGKTVEVALEQAVGCSLAENISAVLPLPHFDNSAMDGYAIRAEDAAGASEANPVEFSVLRVVAAGDDVSDGRAFHIGQGQAAQIFTGAMVPDGADTVVRQEDVQRVSDGIIALTAPVKKGANVRRCGEEIQLGDAVMKIGDLITPAGVGLLASFGITSVSVNKAPRVGCLVTGSELVVAGNALPPGKIYDSNSLMLASALSAMGLKLVYGRTCPDDRECLQQALVDALDTCDVMLVSGGVSVGDYDFVKQVSARAGIEQIFWKVFQKPGKPLFFGATPDREKFLFGLPGNPASALTCFYEYVKPALLRMMGSHDPQPKALCGRLRADVSKRPGLTHFMKGRLHEDGSVEILEFQGSHMMSSFARANCLVVLPQEAENLQKGEQVEVHLIDG